MAAAMAPGDGGDGNRDGNGRDDEHVRDGHHGADDGNDDDDDDKDEDTLDKQIADLKLERARMRRDNTTTSKALRRPQLLITVFKFVPRPGPCHNSPILAPTAHE
jgi:hypothetical protein